MNNQINTTNKGILNDKRPKWLKNLFREHGNKYNPTRPSKFARTILSTQWQGGDH